MNDDPLIHIIRIVINSNCVTSRTVNEYIRPNVKDLKEARQNMIQSVINNNSSRRVTYRDINPLLAVSDIYTQQHTINEHHRVAFTRFRLSGNTFVCETGRWNRRGRGRLPLEDRLCVCGQVQTEVHVVTSCPLSQNLRDIYGFSDIQSLELSL